MIVVVQQHIGKNVHIKAARDFTQKLMILFRSSLSINTLACSFSRSKEQDITVHHFPHPHGLVIAAIVSSYRHTPRSYPNQDVTPFCFHRITVNFTLFLALRNSLRSFTSLGNYLRIQIKINLFWSSYFLARLLDKDMLGITDW